MSKAILLVLVCMLAGLVAAWLAVRVARHARRGELWPFVSRSPLTEVEQVLYFRLVQALPQYVVLAQVPMSAFLRVRKGRPYREWMNRISQKSVDYLVCRRDFSIVAAIELDDATHDRPRRRAADAAKNRALAGAGVPLVRWKVTSLPDFDAIRAMLGTVLEDRSNGTEVLPGARIEPSLHAAGLQVTHVEASNDSTIVKNEKRL